MYADLTQIAIIAFSALLCGLLFEKLKQPAVLGYIFAGIVLSFFDLVQNRDHIHHLAELGIQMLLFLIGLELSLKTLKSVWHITIITALLQICVSIIVILGLSKIFNWPFGLSLVLAFSIALSSTAVGIKMLQRVDELHTETGRIAVGILIAQDLMIVPIILTLRGLGGEGGFNSTIFAKILISISLLLGLIWFFGRARDIKLPFSKIISENHDLTPIAALVFCFGCALVAGVMGISEAYGAFLGGLVLGNTTERHKMVETTKPIQGVLLMVFFLSIGLLMDIRFIWEHFGKVLILLSFITVGKTLLNISILHFLKQSWDQAFIAGLVLAQMGEFGFLLTTVGYQAKLIDAEGSKLIISLTALSLAFSPFWMATARRLHELRAAHSLSLKQLLNLIYGKEIKTLHKTFKSLKKNKNVDKKINKIPPKLEP